MKTEKSKTSSYSGSDDSGMLIVYLLLFMPLLLGTGDSREPLMPPTVEGQIVELNGQKWVKRLSESGVWTAMPLREAIGK